MSSENPPPRSFPPRRVSRWSPSGSSPSPGRNPSRLTFRLIGIPALAVAGVLFYRGLHDRFTLPECDSSRAKATLADVLKQLKSEPLAYEPIKTISTSKDRVACNAALPLSDSSTLNIDYSFFWEGTTADMKYSISRKPAENSVVEPPKSQ